MLNSFCNFCCHMQYDRPDHPSRFKTLRRSGRLGQFVVSHDIGSSRSPQRQEPLALLSGFSLDFVTRSQKRFRKIQYHIENLMSRTFSNFKHCSNSAHTRCEYSYVINIFFYFNAIQAEFIRDYWNKSDRPDRLSRLRAFFHMIALKFTRSSRLHSI